MESRANPLVSTPAPKKAMTQTMGEFKQIRLRPSKRDFFRASSRKYASTGKIGPAAGSLRGNSRPGSTPASRRSVPSEITSAATTSAHASLRSVRAEIRNLRGGNDARKKTPRLGIRQKAPDSHIPIASTTTISLYLKPSRAPPHRIR